MDLFHSPTLSCDLFSGTIADRSASQSLSTTIFHCFSCCFPESLPEFVLLLSNARIIVLLLSLGGSWSPFGVNRPLGFCLTEAPPSTKTCLSWHRQVQGSTSHDLAQAQLRMTSQKRKQMYCGNFNFSTREDINSPTAPYCGRASLLLSLEASCLGYVLVKSSPMHRRSACTDNWLSSGRIRRTSNQVEAPEWLRQRKS